MPERVYLGDWLYNAGIVGFIDIMLDGKNLDDQDIITVGENYIEFDRNDIIGFSDKFFNNAYRKYLRTDKLLDYCAGYINNLQYDSDIKKINTEIKEKFNNAYLKKFIDISKYDMKNKDGILSYLNDCKKIIEENKDKFIENDVKIYLNTLTGLYGGKNFLNITVTDNLKDKFKTEYEDKITNDSNKKDTKNMCIICGKKAKKGATFDKGLSTYLGANDDNKNMFWNFNSKLPLCDICELIYFSVFAGLTNNPYDYKKFYFVNMDTSITDLYNANKLLMNELKKDDNIYNQKSILNFFAEYLLLKVKKEANYTIQNISFVELDISSSILPKIFALNISLDIADFLIREMDNIKKLVGMIYQQKDIKFRLTEEVLNQCLKNSLNYNFLKKLEYVYMESLKKESSFKVYRFTPYNLQLINIIIYKFINIESKRSDLEYMSNKIWQMYYSGKELSKELIQKKMENKILSLAYRLLSVLRVGDINGFMNIMIRTYMSLDKKIPSNFVETIQDKDLFYAYGYSFVNGMLNKGSDNENNEKVEEDAE